jgi:hypothetical protein
MPIGTALRLLDLSHDLSRDHVIDFVINPY